MQFAFAKNVNEQSIIQHIIGKWLQQHLHLYVFTLKAWHDIHLSTTMLFVVIGDINNVSTN